MVGIATWGAYAPRLRLQRKAVTSANAWIAPNLLGKAKGERAMANWDEDALTMAVEAARDALGPGDDRTYVDSIYFASTTAPFIDRLNAGVLASALTLEKSVRAADITSSQRCGLTALAQALMAVKSGGAKCALVAAGEHRRARAVSTQELDNGDAGAAIIVDSVGGAADFLGCGVVTDDFVDHFRAANQEFDYHWEERWIRDQGVVRLLPPAISAALDQAKLKPVDITHFCFPSVFPGLAASVARTIGISAGAVRDNLALQLGESGAAHGLIMLERSAALPSAEDLVIADETRSRLKVLLEALPEAERRALRSPDRAPLPRCA